ncbi:MAG: hypothetical protein LBH00_09190 [Planctomycetaceae bacterium]|jgi:hypothetical protein|nr:hypothetical protein [Planctomycetaceae bacterium]
MGNLQRRNVEICNAPHWNEGRKPVFGTHRSCLKAVLSAARQLFFFAMTIENILELRRQSKEHLRLLAEALAKEEAAIRQLFQPEESEMPLEFIEERRQIRWQGGTVKLSLNRYYLLKTIWEAKDHAADLAVIEKAIWGGSQAINTVSNLVRLTQKDVNEANFPYVIKSVTNFSTRQLKGYCLVFAGFTKKCE